MTADRSATPPLVLAAGLLCDESIWQAVAGLVRADVSIRSFAGFASITAMAAALLDRAPPRFALAGHSMGARVALEAYRLAPDRIAGLALCNAGIHPLQPHEADARGRLVALARSEGMSALAEAWLPPMMGDGIADEALMERLRAMVERQTPESFAGQIGALLGRPEAEAVLASVDVPLLLFAADRDRWSPVEQHRAMLRLASSARLVVIAGAGHMAPAEAPHAVAAALIEWLAVIATGGP